MPGEDNGGKTGVPQVKMGVMSLARWRRIKYLVDILFPLIRIGISGSSVSPEIFGTLVVLGKPESLERLRAMVALLDA